MAECGEHVWVVQHDSGAGDGGYTVPCVCSSLENARAVVKQMGGEIERYVLDGDPDTSIPETPRAASPLNH